MLCNPNFTHSKIIGVSIRALYISSTHLHLYQRWQNWKNLFPLGRTESLFHDHVLALLCLLGSIKGECLLSCERDDVESADGEREAACSKASLTL